MVRRVLLRPFSRSSNAAVLSICTLVALSLAAFSVLPASALAVGSGPVASYSFDEGTGETVEDLSGNGHTATIHGAEWTTHGKYGGAMEFDAAEGDYVSIPDSPQLDFTEEFTLEAWVRPDSNSGEYGPLITKQTPGSGAQPYFLYEGSWDPDIPYGGTDENTEQGVHARAGEPLPRNAWSHLALTFDGSRIKLYVDGQLVSQVTGNPPTTSEGDLEIGAAGEVESYLSGRVDEARIYDRVLTAAEVGLDMETPLQTPRKGPVAAWSFDEGKGTVAQDLTGHGHTATISKATWTRGRFGASLKFDGKKSCVTVAHSPELDFSEELTLEAWVRPVGSGPEAGPLIVQDDETAGPTEEGYAYYLLGGENEVPKAWVRKAGSGFDGVYGTEPLPEKAWSHETLTDDGAHLRLYLDGQLVRTAAAPQLTTGEGPLQIGCDIFGTHFEGRIDEVRLYDRALNTGEVDADMEAPVQTPKTGPVAAYSFDEGSGETVADLTGNGHTATIQGAEWTTHGKYGGAMEFDAEKEDFLSIPASTSLDGTEELTVEAWVRPETAPEYSSILMKEREGSGPRYSYALYQHNDQTSGYFEESEEGVLISPEHSLPTGAWTHVAITDDGAWSRLYVNGALVYTTPAVPIEGHGEIRIGGNSIYGEYLDGRVDEVRIYDRSLDATEVDADMETPLQTPKTGPVAAYSFDEGEGTVLHDVTGHGHEGTIEGPEWAPGKYGGALEFDAAEGDVVTVPDSEELRLSEEFTLEAWVRPDPGESFAAVATKTAAKEYGYGLASNGSVGAEQHPMGYVAYDQYVNSHAYSGGAIPTHVWTHLAVVDDGAHIRLYVNGQLVDERVSEPVRPGGGPLVIGGESLTTDAFFDGRIDELRVYGRALNGGEVATDMEAPLQTPRQGPIAAYGFDEGEGTTAEDLTGDGHTGTVEGAEWVRGKYGDALKFDGESDVVKVPNSPEFALTEAFTLEAWVRPESVSNEWAPVLAKEMGGGQAATELAYWLYEGDAQSNVPYGGTEPVPGEEDRAEADSPLPVGAWSHLALTWDGTKVRLYVDGQLADCSPVVPAGAPRVTEGELQIGAATEHGDYYDGRIDEVRIYNRPLAQAEVAESMNTTFPAAVTEPVEEVNSNDAVMTGIAKVQGEGTEYFFEYGPTTEYEDIANGEEISGDGESVEVEEVAVDLSPETTYHYRLVAEGPLGIAYGKDQTFTTGERTMTVEEEEEEKAAEEAAEEEAAPSMFQPLANPAPSDFYGMMWSGDIQKMIGAHAFNAIENSGAKWFRFVVAPGAAISDSFAQAQSHNLKPLPYFGAGPIPKPETPARTKYLNEAKQYVETYGPSSSYKTKVWEIWNEPNMPQPPDRNAPESLENGEYQGHVNPQEFAVFYKEVVEAMRSVAPNIEFLAPGLFGYKGNDEKNGEIIHLKPKSYLKRFNKALTALNLNNPYQGVSLHPYIFKTRLKEKDKKTGKLKVSKAHVPKEEDDAKQIRNEIKGMITGVDHVDMGQPVWVTELGFPVISQNADGSPDTKIPPVQPDEQRELVHWTFSMMHGSAGRLRLEHSFYYNIEDLPGHSWEHHSGLLTEDHKPRPAWKAYSKLAGGHACPFSSPC